MKIQFFGRNPPSVQVAITAAAVCVVLAVEIAARSGLALADPRPLFLLTAVYAAAFGGVVPAVVTVAVALGYSLHYFADGGHAERSALKGAVQAWVFALIAPATIAVVLAKRRRSARQSTVALTEERGRSDAVAAETAELNLAVLNSLPAHIAVVDGAGNILSTNNAWDRFAAENAGGTAGGGDRAMGPADASSKNYLDVCRRAGSAGDALAKSVADGIAAVLERRVPQFSLEYPCHSPTRQRWFLLTVTPLASEGRDAVRRGAVVSHLDITERRLAEQSVRQRAAELAVMTRDLKRINAELDQFAYITSHDLRAPLRGIANLSQWIEEDLGEQVPDETREQLALLRGRVGRMEAMIDGILQYSRIGRVQTEVRQVDVGELLAEIVDLLDVPAAFAVDVQPGMPVLVTERLRLQQVFQNLIANAIKHHDKPRGTIRIGWREEPAGGRYEFSVADDGPGIEPQYHERIFTMFQTLQPRDRVEGTGVGLAVVRKTVEHLGGTVTIESEPGRGTTFRFTWPKVIESPPPQPAQAVEPAALASSAAVK